MNIVVWLPFMTGYTAFSPKPEDKGLKGKGSVWFYHFPHPSPYFTAPDLSLYTYNLYKVSKRVLTVLRVTDQEYVFSLCHLCTIGKSYVLNWKTEKFYKKK